MSDIERFRHTRDGKLMGTPDGDWVSYADHQAAIDRAEAEKAAAVEAMRERCAAKLSEILDGWEIIRKYHQPGSFAGDAAIASIRALPTKGQTDE
jgi:hypothetical protein